MGEFDEFDRPPAPAPAAGGEFSEFDAPHGEAAPAPLPTRSFLDRASFAIHHPIESAKEEADLVGHSVKDSFTRFGHQAATAARGALDLVSPVSREGGLQVPFHQLADPAYRHELERGISDAVTFGGAEKVANLADPSFAAAQPAEAAAAPEARAVGNAVGTALPSPAKLIAGKAASAIPGTGVVPSAARGVVGYEAAAVPQAATQAALNAPEGHRLEAAGHAALETATDPAALAAAGGVPAITSFLQKRLDVAREKAPEIQEAAKKRAVKDLGKDITEADGPKARVTDQKRIAEVNDRLYDLADQNPELRQAFAEPAEKALPKIRAFKAGIAQPLDRLYDAIDESTKGGLDPRQVVQEFRSMAREEARSVAGLDDAARLEKLADRFEKVYITDRESPIGSATHGGGFPPSHSEEWWKETQREWEGKKGHSTVGEATNPGAKGAAIEEEREFPLATLNQLKELRKTAKGVAADAIDAQIEKLEEKAPKAAPPPAPVGIPRIPTRVFRAEVTDLLKKSDSIMGGLEGTPRFEALQKLYEAGKQIIDKHIDGSGLPPDQIRQIRDINNGYFLATRAEQAIESRGWKEANKPGFKFPTSVRAAAHGGGIAGLATAAALGGPHAALHALPVVAGTALATHALPAAMKSINWSLAHGSYGRAINNLIDLARKTPRAEFIGQAARAGLPIRDAQRIFDSANQQQGASP